MSVLFNFSIMPAHPVSWWRHVLTPLGMWPGATLSHQLSKTTERVITSECCQVPGPLAWHQVLSSGAGCQTLHSPAGADSGQARNILFIAIWGGSYIKMTTRKKNKSLALLVNDNTGCLSSHVALGLSLRVLHGLATAPLPHAWCCHALTSVPLVAPLSGKIVQFSHGSPHLPPLGARLQIGN